MKMDDLTGGRAYEEDMLKIKVEGLSHLVNGLAKGWLGCYCRLDEDGKKRLPWGALIHGI